MFNSSRTRTRAFAALVVVAAAVAALSASTGHTNTGALHVATPATMGPGGPAYQQIGQPEATGNNVAFGCQTRLPSAFPASSCYGPQQIWKAYGIDGLQAQG